VDGWFLQRRIDVPVEPRHDFGEGACRRHDVKPSCDLEAWSHGFSHRGDVWKCARPVPSGYGAQLAALDQRKRAGSSADSSDPLPSTFYRSTLA
jgi:hypothetical protein